MTLAQLRAKMALHRGINRRLHETADRGDSAAVLRLLRDGADLRNEYVSEDVLGTAGRSPWGNAETVRVLLNHGATPNGRRASPGYPLMRAAQLGNLDILRLLLERGAAVNVRDVCGTPLLWAARENGCEVVRLLLEWGADPNLVSAPDPAHSQDQCRTPLMVAAAKGDDEMVRLLLEYGADINARTPAGTSALGFAERYQNASTVQLLTSLGACAWPP